MKLLGKYYKWDFGPQQIAALVAAIILLTTATCMFWLSRNILLSAGLGAILAILIYFLILNFIEVFIYHRIRTLYRIIQNTQIKKPKSKELRSKNLDEVQKDVLIWSQNRNEEVRKLEQNNEFRKEFLQNLSHELKTPIFTIQGYIETLQEGAIDDRDVAVRFLHNASKGVERLVALAKSLDNISALESGNLELEQRDFDFHRMMQDIYEEMALEAKDRNILLEKPQTVDKLNVYGDQALLKQAVVNLISNSLKYCLPEDKIYYKIFSIDDKKIMVEVSDTGPGIEEEHLNRIFERFYRTDKSRSRNIGGSGLGLAITKHIVEAHGESISCRSQLGKGTTFAFTLAKA